MKRAGLLLLFLPLPAGPLRAADSPFTWERTSAHLTVPADERTVTVDFPFRNDRRTAVTILSLETSCRCLAATSPQLTYAAGAKGIIEVAMAIGDQRGALEKSVTVTTNAPGAGPTELVLRVDVPVSR